MNLGVACTHRQTVRRHRGRERGRGARRETGRDGEREIKRE